MAHVSKPAGDCVADCLIAQAVGGLAVGLVLLTPGGRVVWLNRTAEQILEVSRSAAVGRPIERILRDPQLAAFWHDAAGRAGNHLAEVSVRWPREAELKLNATHCRDQNGVEIGRALLICDVTSEKTAQVELSRAVAARLLDLTGGHAPPAPAAGLTQQELRILRLLGRGLGNGEIAEQAGVSPATVRSHLKNVYRKLGLGSRAEAVSFAVRNHLA